MKYLIKFSNYTDLNKLLYLFGGMIVLTYVSNEYFQYEIILNTNNLERIGFWSFLKIQFSNGFTVNKINTGWIGWIVIWIVQLGLTGIFIYFRLAAALTKYILERVPPEVVDFTFYHLIKDKSEEEIRTELSKKGWSDVQHQNEAFEAIVGHQNVIALSRVK
jgi:hypothetical protein